MGTAAKLIDINGRHYDAVSGKLIRNNKATAATSVISQQPQLKKGVIDGFMAPKRRPKAATSPSKTSPVKASKAATSKPSHATHTKLQHSKTLMRRAVKKPTNKTVSAISHAGGLNARKMHNNSGATILLTKQDQARAERAAQTKRHQAVHKFAAADVSFMPVKTSSNDTYPIHQSNLETATVKQNTPAPVAPALPSMVSSASHGVLDRMLDHALHEADSHKQRPLKKRRGLRIMPRWAAISSSALAIVLLAGFFAYQNMPNVAMRLAAKQAGINASVPGYSPSGFAFNGPIAVQDGVITLRFNANADANRNFSISQRSSDWDSKSLLNNFVIANGYAYQTHQDKGGNTVYVYDDAHATWVSKGIWYTIEGDDASLNADQLLRIAASM